MAAKTGRVLKKEALEKRKTGDSSGVQGGDIERGSLREETQEGGGI